MSWIPLEPQTRIAAWEKKKAKSNCNYVAKSRCRGQEERRREKRSIRASRRARLEEGGRAASRPGSRPRSDAENISLPGSSLSRLTRAGSSDKKSDRCRSTRGAGSRPDPAAGATAPGQGSAAAASAQPQTPRQAGSPWQGQTNAPLPPQARSYFEQFSSAGRASDEGEMKKARVDAFVFALAADRKEKLPTVDEDEEEFEVWENSPEFAGKWTE